MGLGSVADVSLAEARELASAARKQVRAGEDPIAERRRGSANAKTFGEVADELLIELEPGWKHAAHRQQWRLHPTKMPRRCEASPSTESLRKTCSAC